ncbi:MAG: hypothetical protein RIB60_07935 [Phycisphaerales bacterium]
MDDRQAQIKEGAGLEENRINQDLVDFLEKWSAPFLFVLALIMAGYWGWGKLEQMREAHVAEAFAAYTSATSGDNPSPDSLKRVADEYADVPGAAAQARLRAARVYLEAVWFGTEPGTELGPGGQLLNEEDALTDDEIDAYLTAADDQYRLVLELVEGDAGMWVLELDALWGRAAVAASRGDVETARSYYQQIEALETAQARGLQARAAARLAENVDQFVETPYLYGNDELPPIILQGSEDASDAILDNLPTNDEVPTPLDDAAPAEDSASPVEGDTPADDTPVDDDATPAEDPASDDGSP